MCVKNSIGRKASTRSHFSTTKKNSVIAIAAGLGAFAISTAARADILVWTNGGADNQWNNTDANDWNDASNSNTPTAYSDGSAVQFSDSGPGGTISISNVTGSSAGVSPASVEFTHGTGSAGGYTFNDSAGGTNGIEGAATLTLDSGYVGTVYLDAVMSYTGLTTVNGGTLQVTNNGSLPTLGTGSVALGGGTLAVQHTITTFGNAISLTSGTTSSIVLNASGDNVTQTGTLSGAANTTVNYNGNGATWTVAPTSATNTWAGFSGTFNVATGSFLRYNPNAVGDAVGSQSDVINLGSGTSTGQVLMQNSTGAVLMGALEGGASTTVNGSGHSGSNLNNYGEFVIGGAGLNTTFNGVISGGAEGRTAISITGGGSLTLTNGNTYATKTGSVPNYQGAGTTILGNGQEPLSGASLAAFLSLPSNGGGKLLVSNTTGSATGVTPVYIQGASSAVNSGNGIAGGTLGGDGIIQGEVSTVAGGANEQSNSSTPLGNFAAGPHIAPQAVGSNTSTTITLSGSLLMGDYANLDMSLEPLPTSPGNSLIAVSNTTSGNGNFANSLTLPGDGNIEVNFSFPAGNPGLGVPYNLITYTGTDLYSNSGTSASLANWVATNVPAGDNVAFNDTGSAITATFTAVPEPASFGLLAVGALGLLRRRRARA